MSISLSKYSSVNPEGQITPELLTDTIFRQIQMLYSDPDNQPILNKANNTIKEGLDNGFAWILEAAPADCTQRVPADFYTSRGQNGEILYLIKPGIPNSDNAETLKTIQFVKFSDSRDNLGSPQETTGICVYCQKPTPNGVSSPTIYLGLDCILRLQAVNQDSVTEQPEVLNDALDAALKKWKEDNNHPSSPLLEILDAICPRSILLVRHLSAGQIQPMPDGSNLKTIQAHPSIRGITSSEDLYIYSITNRAIIFSQASGANDRFLSIALPHSQIESIKLAPVVYRVQTQGNESP